MTVSQSDPPGPPRPEGAGPSLRHLLEETDRFLTLAELVTGRGGLTEPSGRRTLALGSALAANPRIDAVSVTDNAGGNPMIAPDVVGLELAREGQEVIIHLACKDWNRNALQSRLWNLAGHGFDNILALSGDYPVGGYEGLARPVFDIDSVGLLRLIADMNEGLEVDAARGTRLEPASFFPGAVVTNHKRHEREVMPQYFKLRKKVENGAAFVINQVGYDARKDDELLRWMQLHGLVVPVIANVYVLSGGVARVFHSERIPGVVVTDALLEVAQREAASPDKGRAFFLDLAARQVAIARGLGFRGAYLGGHLEPDDYDRILETADSFAPDDWRAFAREIQFSYPDEFHYFEHDPESGLSSSEPNRAYVASRRDASKRRAGIGYRTSRAMHHRLFEPGTRAFAVGRRLYGALDDGPAALRRLAHGAEHVSKSLLYECRDCGDCSLPEIAFLCPESQCVKNQRNGPCGGTRQGLCEIGEKECIWARAYDRLKAFGEEERMLDGPAVIKNGGLQGTSAWANTYLGRDHHARHDPQRAAEATEPGA